ncbi:MAG: pyridoxamine 5'-phosphate oxidase family protein [Chloroflexia bacterium]|nr:pyridoxamine 5'-phosphate oxidase family protein [Chloroflexia bacterium]MDQ3411787.1 pyridoxamine 5'-phosphate oxidase family protein [Chloroflexota bacterium]
MGQVYDTIDGKLAAWIGRQPLFFVATAPNAADGHVNVSPKGEPAATLRITGPTTAAYLDLTGSGIETVAHLRENGRIVLMFCAFAGPPKIVRLHGQGRVVPAADPEFATLLAHFQPDADTRRMMRSIIVVEVSLITDSCGFVVPRMDYVGEREQLQRWSERQEAKRGDGWKQTYWQANNTASIDGLTGLDPAEPANPEETRAFSSAGRAL